MSIDARSRHGFLGFFASTRIVGFDRLAVGADFPAMNSSDSRTNVTATEPGRTGATTLDLLPFGAQARVVGVNANHPSARRLMEMGVVPGATVSVLRAAPLGDPLQIEVHGTRLAVRRAEASAVSVAPA